MRASDITFEELRLLSSGIPQLATLMSYIQVEYGIDDLRASWQGFSDSSDYYGSCFRSKQHLCSEFGNLLREYLEFQPLPV